MIEGDLVHKLQSREREVQEFFVKIRDQDEKLRIKTEAIEKAQKVIQKLNEEMDKSSSIICKLEKERDQLRSELKEQSRRLSDMTKQLHSQIAL